MSALRDLLLVAAREVLEGEDFLSEEIVPSCGSAPGLFLIEGPGVLDLGAIVEAVGRAALLDAAATVEQLRVGEQRFPAAPVTIAKRIREDAAALSD